MSINIRTKLAAAALTGLAVFQAAPAFAASSFTTYMAGVSPGFTSRTWSDDGVGSTSTSVELQNCVMSNGSTFNYTDIALYRENGIFLPTLVSTMRNRCSISDYGMQPQSNYHFSLATINGSTASSTKMNATYVLVTY